jgi:hypothetical protein
VSTRLRNTIYVCAVLAVVAVATVVFLNYERARADTRLAMTTAATLSAGFDEVKSGQSSTMVQFVMAPRVMLFLDSDAAKHSPGYEPIANAWSAYRVIHDLYLYEESQEATQAPVADIPGAAHALALWPKLRSRVAVVRGQERFTDDEAVKKFLTWRGVEEIQRAAAVLNAQATRLGFDSDAIANPYVLESGNTPPQ